MNMQENEGQKVESFRRADDGVAIPEAAPERSEPAPRPRNGRRIGRALLFFAGSALFGGVAVALWERKTIAEIRRREAEGLEEIDQELTAD